MNLAKMEHYVKKWLTCALWMDFTSAVCVSLATMADTVNIVILTVDFKYFYAFIRLHWLYFILLL